MNRLQKKCVIGIVGVHLLLGVILVAGPAFFYAKPKADDLQVLDVIPANLIDAQFSSGVANATPPPPAPVVTPPQPAPPAPPAPQPVVKPPSLIQELEKALKPEPVKPPDKLSPDNLTPVEKPAKTEPHKIQISTQLVARTAPKNSPAADNSQQQQRLAQASQSVLRILKSNLTSDTTIDMPGNSSVAYADYGRAVTSIYDQAWSLPANIANDEANAKVSVTIASDGTVISARIVTPSGDAHVDASVQRTLERVKFIAPFPKDATEKERTYIINFNLNTTRLLG